VEARIPPNEKDAPKDVPLPAYSVLGARIGAN
jgi:hypothetical protein